MKYIQKKDTIIISNCEDFDIKQILECGQVFSYNQIDDNTYYVVSLNKWAKITFDDTKTIITSPTIDYFANYFDLKTDYDSIKKSLVKIYPSFAKFFLQGGGIHILKQDEYQTIISFIVSANNNIKRIKKILFAMCEKCGDTLSCGMKSFPTIEELSKLSVEDYTKLGLGYRAEYLFETIKMLQTPEYSIESLSKLNTKELRNKLLTLKGVGPKVADCILFFGFARPDVFPVDTWIRKAYSLFSCERRSDKQIGEFFVNLFKNYSGYAQQYIFNYMITTQNDFKLQNAS